jgi:hypothetical protein
VLASCRPLTSPPPPPPSVMAMPAMAAMGEELQEQLLAWEEELTWREDTLAVREKKVKISKRAPVKVSADVDAKWEKARSLGRSTCYTTKSDTVMKTNPSRVFWAILSVR